MAIKYTLFIKSILGQSARVQEYRYILPKDTGLRLEELEDTFRPEKARCCIAGNPEGTSVAAFCSFEVRYW
jgi:hypothetical protein